MTRTAIIAPKTRRPSVWRRLLRNPTAVISGSIFLIIVLVAIFAPQLAPHDPYVQTLSERRAPPGGEYILGADEFGRDILSRILYGARVALRVGLISTALGLVAGVIL